MRSAIIIYVSEMDKTNFHTAAATAGIVCVVSGFVNHSPVEIGIGASLILTPVLDEVMTLDNHGSKLVPGRGDKDGKGGIYNFVTKRGRCKGVNSKISWTQVETGSAIAWKYPSCLLEGDGSVGEFTRSRLPTIHVAADPAPR